MKSRKSQDQRIEELHAKIAPVGLVPPQALELEQSVLGAMLIDKRSAELAMKVLGRIGDDSDRNPYSEIESPLFRNSPFYRAVHTRIYLAMLALAESKEPIDLGTVVNRLRTMNKLAEVGGPPYLVELTTQVITTVNVELYCRKIVEKFLARQALVDLHELAMRLYSNDDVFETIGTAASGLTSLLDRRHNKRQSFRSLFAVSKDAMDIMQKAQDKPGEITGITSGLAEVDDYTAGWQRGDMIVLGARPSQGKTAFALALAMNAATALPNGATDPLTEQPEAVAFFSLEMSDAMLALRILMSKSGVNMQHARKGTMNDGEWDSVTKAWGRLNGVPFYLFDAMKIGMDGIHAATVELRDQLARENIRLGLVFVDYIALVETSNGDDRDFSREQAVSKISRALKAMAKDLQVTVFALSQLSREIEKRKDHHPVLSDLRESGSLEQDADLVFLLYRPETYGLTQDEYARSTTGVMELILAKQRNGPIGTVRVRFVKENGRFESLPLEFGFNDQSSTDDRSSNDRSARPLHEKQPIQGEAF